MRKYNKVAVGGTFDELHRGHKALLSKAFEVGQEVVIGLSSDEFVAKMDKPHITASYAERFRVLEDYLDQCCLAEKAEIVPLNDPYGLTVSGKGIQAIVVSKETAQAARKINEIRTKAGLSPLIVVAVNMVPAENCIPISTTRIRKGEIDRNGHILKNPNDL
jgi:pantetheine-phosphate adenylyltransferase